MKRFLSLLCILTSCLSLFAQGAGDVVVIPLKGEISKPQFFFLRRALKLAEEQKASAIIVDMDTYGGELKAAVDMQDALETVSIPTITYINTNAGSAGALVALSTKKIYMAPISAIGAAAPVLSTGQDLPSTMTEKVTSYFSGYFRSAAEHNGHNPDIAEAFINKDKEVKIGDEIVHDKGAILTLSAQEAIKVVGGKPLLAVGIADSLSDIAKKENFKGALTNISPAGFEVLASWISTFSLLFLVGGIVCAYLEVKFHGTLIPGFISAACFIIFFAGQYLAGLAGWEVFVVFFIGALLLLSELLVHPGTILPGLAGLVLMIGALLWAMIDRYPDQPLRPSMTMLSGPITTLGSALVIGGVVIAILGRFIPKTKLYGRLVLGASGPQGPSLSTESVDSPARVRVGETGVARSILRPSGKAAFGDAIVDVITNGEFVSPESLVRIVAIEGPRIVVESVGKR